MSKQPAFQQTNKIKIIDIRDSMLRQSQQQENTQEHDDSSDKQQEKEQRKREKKEAGQNKNGGIDNFLQHEKLTVTKYGGSEKDFDHESNDESDHESQYADDASDFDDLGESDHDSHSSFHDQNDYDDGHDDDDDDDDDDEDDDNSTNGEYLSDGGAATSKKHIINMLSKDPLFIVLQQYLTSPTSGNNLVSVLEKLNHNFERYINLVSTMKGK